MIWSGADTAGAASQGLSVRASGVQLIRPADTCHPSRSFLAHEESADSTGTAIEVRGDCSTDRRPAELLPHPGFTPADHAGVHAPHSIASPTRALDSVSADCSSIGAADCGPPTPAKDGIFPMLTTL